MIRSSSGNQCKKKKSKHGQNIAKNQDLNVSTPGRLPWGKDFHRGRLDCLDSTHTSQSMMPHMLCICYICSISYGWDMVVMDWIWLDGEDVLFTFFYLFALAWIEKIDVSGQAQMQVMKLEECCIMVRFKMWQEDLERWVFSRRLTR